MIRIEKIESKKDFKVFAAFANRLYSENPYYVPELVSDVLASMNPKSNPAFEFCDVAYYLAYNHSNEVVGRLGVILNRKSNQKWNQKYVRFTSFDFVDDYAVSSALLETGIAWAKEHGMETLHGPLGFTDLDH
ncbi:MAG TPA: N-acetyltransferase, partial [Clostridiales bacterium UBA8960]|nr:N-acetyltransferase [Clostridiales bacterium UBA8960]